jgi:hypothetical protein
MRAPWINLMRTQQLLAQVEAQERLRPKASETTPRIRGVSETKASNLRPSPKTKDSNSRPPRPTCPRLSNSRPLHPRPGNLGIGNLNPFEYAMRSYPSNSNVEHLETRDQIFYQPTEFKIQMPTTKSYLDLRRSRDG